MSRFLSCLVLAALVAAPAYAQNSSYTLVQCDQGKSVQAAVDNTREGGLIEVSGSCHEAVTIRRDRVQLTGQPGAVFTAPAGTRSVVTVLGHLVEIRGFAINAVGVRHGVSVDLAGSALIQGNEISNAESFNILVTDGGQGVIDNNAVLASAAFGVGVIDGSSARITNNTIENSANVGVQVDGGFARVTDNQIRDGGSGIWLRNRAGGTISGNTIERPAHSGIGVVEASGATIGGNTIDAASGDGIKIEASSAVILPSFARGANKITNGSIGVRCGASGALILQVAQNFSRNTEGDVVLASGCDFQDQTTPLQPDPSVWELHLSPAAVEAAIRLLDGPGSVRSHGGILEAARTENSSA